MGAGEGRGEEQTVDGLWGLCRVLQVYHCVPQALQLQVLREVQRLAAGGAQLQAGQAGELTVGAAVRWEVAQALVRGQSDAHWVDCFVRVHVALVGLYFVGFIVLGGKITCHKFFPKVEKNYYL